MTDQDGELAGYAHYVRRTVGDREVTSLDRTVVFPDFQGQGIGGRLARAALADVRRRGGLVEPRCPFIAGWIEKHPDHRDLVATGD
ncbi:MAG: N-acetyltransferase [Propionibacterium sp.]|nr:N-acetyltransferase [Propionibacterium sp.]